MYNGNKNRSMLTNTTRTTVGLKHLVSLVCNEKMTNLHAVYTEGQLGNSLRAAAWKRRESNTTFFRRLLSSVCFPSL